MTLMSSLFVFILLPVVCLLLILYGYIKYQHTYWKRKNVKGPTPTVPSGNMGGVLTKSKHFSDPIIDIYRKYKNEKYIGFYAFHTPVLMVNDLDLIKDILVKDFEYFDSHGFAKNSKIDPLNNHLFNHDGVEWRTMRTKLTPIFTSGKIKSMLHVMLAVQKSLSNYLKEHLRETNVVGVKSLLSNFTVDIIANCVYGIEVSTFTDKNSLFKKMALEGIKQTTVKQQIASFASVFAPSIFDLLRMSTVSEEVTDYTTKLVKQSIEYRSSNNIRRDDFLQFLMDLNTEAADVMSIDSIIAQCFLFILAGYETSSSASSFTLYELAFNTEWQDKVRAEIKEKLEKYDGNITYEALQEMELLTLVIEETTRLHPALAVLFRKCTKNYKLDDTLTIEKGTRVYIPIYGIHTDSQYYPDPEKFDPERFIKEEKLKRHKMTHLPFGEGPRICIGMRFGMLQMKVALITILSQYKVSISKYTKSPITLDRTAIVLFPEEDIDLEFTPLS